MARLLAGKLALARAVGAASRMRGGGATSAPGKTLLKLQPDAIERLSERLDRGSVLVSATNGKTTTAALAASIMRCAGISLVHNQAGANMAGGIATTLLKAAGARGGIAGEMGLFEVDELWLGRLTAELHPRVIVLGNLFRDQLDRYGELETIAEHWDATLRGPAGAQARLVCNADDPLVADLGRERAETTIYYGVEDDSLALADMAHAADAKHCRRCGAPYEFEVVYLGHLGRYHCPACAQRRPDPAVLARNVRLEGVRSARFELSVPEGKAEVKLALPGLYNVYNALAAAALAVALRIPLAQIVAGLQSTEAAFGRAESVTIDKRDARILLVKNPAGANEVLRTLALEPGRHDLLGILNDRTADGHDVSWIWDADFELLAGRVGSATCSGTRAAELALRLKYAGVEAERIQVVEDLPRALARACSCSSSSSQSSSASVPSLSQGGDEDLRPGAWAEEEAGTATGTPPLYVLPTYTAMLELRELLAARGEVRSSWR
jgi:lipid II isoglutaminyl synthase (glutamine-hydrolysing)